MKIIISESQYKSLIKESKFKIGIQNQLDETLNILKKAVEVEPRDFTQDFSENIDNVESINIVNIEKEIIKDNLKLIIDVVLTLTNDIPFNKWVIVDEILTELTWEMKQQMTIDLKLKLADDGLKIMNNRKDW